MIDLCKGPKNRSSPWRFWKFSHCPWKCFQGLLCDQDLNGTLKTGKKKSKTISLRWSWWFISQKICFSETTLFHITNPTQTMEFFAIFQGIDQLYVWTNAFIGAYFTDKQLKKKSQLKESYFKSSTYEPYPISELIMHIAIIIQRQDQNRKF